MQPAQPTQPALFEEPTLSVGELSAGIASALARAFPDEVWVRGEIADLSRPPSGHVYFTLTGDDACVPVTLFASERAVVNGVLRRAGGAVRMTDGTEVRIRARVGWFGRRGVVQLRMLSIDPAYTLGRLAEARELLVRRLASDGLLERQAALPVATAPWRVGLITSTGSAAEADFLDTLAASGFGWRVVVADARVQGVDAAASVVAALGALARRAVDVVCIVRGGGARTDLAAFDDETVARAIAACPVPVFTGIGHEVDTSVADLVARQATKTPTACAAALVEQVQAYVARCGDAEARLDRAAGTALRHADDWLARAAGRAAGACRHHLRAEEQALTVARSRLSARAPRVVEAAGRSLDAVAARVSALDPARVLARGWSITRHAGGVVVRSAGDVAAGDELVTTVADGEVRSVAR